MEHLNGNYKESNNFLEQAYIMVDDGIRTSAGQTVAANLTNPMSMPYKGEDFEKVTVHYYMALNYFMVGQPAEALVEAKRINLKLLQLNDKYKKHKNKYTKDAFSQILQGLIYESTGDINNAFIAYRNAEEIYTGSGGTYYGVAIPQQLKDDLLRTSYNLGFMQEYNEYLTKFNITKPLAPAKYTGGEAIVFWENGLGPVKDQIVVTVSGAGLFFYASYMEDGQIVDILLPIPLGTDLGTINAIAIPKYNRSYSYYSNATLNVNGKEKSFETAQDFFPLAKQSLKDRMLREAVNIAVRFASKKAASAIIGAITKEAFKSSTGGDIARLGADVAGAVTEKADTRNWQSLPATISYIRVPLTENGPNEFTIKKHGPNGVVDTDTIKIPYKRGLQIVNYFDLGRTQVIPAEKQAEIAAASAPKMEAKYAAKYDKWIDTEQGISYKVSYYPTTDGGQNLWGKKIVFKTSGTTPTKITYTLTDKPYDSKMTVVTLDEFEKLEDENKADGAYYSLTDRIKPNQETPGWYPFVQQSADFYVTILKVEN